MCFKKLNKRTSSRMMLASVASISTLTLGAAVSRAQSPSPIPGLYNTGVNNDGSLATQGVADPHYWLVANPQGGSGPYVTNQASWQLAGGGWAADTATSQWISPHMLYVNSGTATTDAVGNYTYQTTFNLGAQFDPSTATIAGQYFVDNAVLEIDLNGVNTDNPGRPSGSGNTQNLGSFAINSGFVTGINTLDFIVDNTGGITSNPSGIEIENMTGAAVDPPVVPEPASLGLMTVAVVGLASRRRLSRQSRIIAAV